MVLRFEHRYDTNRDNFGKIETSSKFVEFYKDGVMGELTSFFYFNDKIWKEAIKELPNFNSDVSTKLQQLLIAGVSTFQKLVFNH